LPGYALIASSAATSEMPFHMNPVGGPHPTEKALDFLLLTLAQVSSKMDSHHLPAYAVHHRQECLV